MERSRIGEYCRALRRLSGASEPAGAYLLLPGAINVSLSRECLTEHRHARPFSVPLTLDRYQYFDDS